MARAVISSSGRRAAYEPIYDMDPRTGASVEVFYVDHVLAHSFGARGPGWFWWTSQRSCLPECMATGPFANSYLAYRDFAGRGAWRRKFQSGGHKFPPVDSPLLPQREPEGDDADYLMLSFRKY